MSDWPLLLAYTIVVAAGLLLVYLHLPGLLASWFGWVRQTPIARRSNPAYIFRLVERADRAAYARIMRRTYAVKTRDMQRAINRAGREIGKALLPPVQALAEQMARFVR